ncbi:MAG: SUMF1/EgtB/PvdO family nonheme iron enzyme [Nitrospiraceae bacterium]|nr:MAG: SUMF1/EgtB/PvdO family nonheme iron enzyme [Nitrospiraceae bacterium]
MAYRLTHIPVLCPLLFLSLFFSLVSHVYSQDVTVTSQKGESIYLYSDYYALVVGVSTYDKWPDLPDATQNAAEVSSFLRKTGFRVRLMTDPTSLELKKAFEELVREGGDNVDIGMLFYFAGHGETRNLPDGSKLGWIIPSDCPPIDEDSEAFSRKAISMSEIERYSKRILSKHVLMLFDAFLSGVVFKVETPFLEEFTLRNALPVRQYIIAGSDKDSSANRHLFHRLLLKGLREDADMIADGFITGSELGVYLLSMISNITSDTQHPQYGKHNHISLAQGDFVFDMSRKALLTGRLFLETKPDDTHIRILNVPDSFSQGIELKPGTYTLEFSRSGYDKKTVRLDLSAGEDRVLSIALDKQGREIQNGLGMKFMLIKPGSFTMGSPDEEHDTFHDEVLHKVTLTEPFYLQTTEVTVGQFRKFVKNTGFRTEAENGNGCWISKQDSGWKIDRNSSWDNPGSWNSHTNRQMDQHPVTCISWNDVIAFINWLNRRDEGTYRLPSEAEWEYAARAGSTSPFAFGKCLSSDHANFGSPGPEFSHCRDEFKVYRGMPVLAGTLSPNKWGIYNMHGNVSEWCSDWYGSYPSKPSQNPKGPSSGTERVIRGGHWRASAYASRSARRTSFKPDFASDVIGFRLIMRP